MEQTREYVAVLVRVPEIQRPRDFHQSIKLGPQFRLSSFSFTRPGRHRRRSSGGLQNEPLPSTKARELLAGKHWLALSHVPVNAERALREFPPQ